MSLRLFANRANVIASALCASVIGLFGLSGQSQDPPPQQPLVREIFVPFDDLNVLLEGAPQHVFLSREDYEKLLAEAAQRPGAVAPIPTTILSADYRITISEGRAAIAADLAIEVLADGIHAVPVTVAGVGLKSVTIDDATAAVGRSPDGQFVLFITGRGTHRVHLDMTAMVQTSAAQQVLQAQLPTTASSHLRLIVPGNVELKSGAHVVKREVNEERKETEFELMPPPGPLSLVMSLNSHILRRDRVMVARSVVLDEIAEGIERVHVTSTFSVLHGATDRVEFRLPAQFEVVHVATEMLSRWSTAPEMEGQQKLTVELRQPATEPVTVTLTAVRFSRDDKKWSFPAVVPLDVEGQVSVVGLLLEQGWRVQHVVSEGLIPIDRNVLAHTIDAEQLARDTGAPAVRPVLAYYAPQADYRLSAQFEKPPQRLEVITSLLLNVDEKGHEITGAFSLRPQVERLFQITFLAPPNWKITSLRDAQGNALAFEIYSADQGAQRIAVRLPQAVPPQGSYTIAFTAKGNIEGWLGEWTEQKFAFPVFRVENAEVDRGAIAILAFSDLDVRPEQLNDLSPLNNDEKQQYGLAQQTDLAFRYEAHPYSATFHVGRRQPSATAQTYSFLKVGKEGLEAHYEVYFSIREATTRRLRVSLSEDTPSEVTITGLGGAVVKEYTSTVEEGVRNWLILLSDNVPLNADREGGTGVAISFQKSLPDEARELPLPIVKALGVEYQTGVVAVEGDAELEIEVTTDARKGNVLDLARSQHQPGKRLLGTFHFVGEPVPVTVDVFRREAHPLPPAIAEKVELWTAVSVNGRAQSLARFHLRTKALLLEARLPPSAELWSVVLDEQPITPQRIGDTVVINLPTSGNRSLRVLDIAFEVPLEFVGLWDSVETSAPHLYLPAPDGEQQAAEVPVADLQWKLLLPKGYSVTYTGGTVHWKKRPTRQRLWDVVEPYIPRFSVDLAGGVKNIYIVDNSQSNETTIRTTEPASGMEGMMRGGGMTSGMPSGDVAESEGAKDLRPQDMMKMAQVDRDSLKGAREPTTEAPADPSFQSGLEFEANQPSQQNAAEGRPGSDSAPQPARPPAKVLADLSGVRSLRVDLYKAFEQAAADQIVELQSLGGTPASKPIMSIRLIHGTRMRFAAWAVGLTVVFFGLWTMQNGWRRFLRFFVVAAMLAVIVPAATGWMLDLDELAIGAGVGLVVLVPLGLLVAAGYGIASAVRRVRVRTAPVAAALLLLATTSLTALGQESDLSVLLQRLGPLPPVVIPPDAILIPYDPAPDSDPRASANRILVPYEKYVELWNRAHPDQPLVAIQVPAEYALAGVNYSATLTAADVLEIKGQIEIDVFVDRTVTIPLALQGGVLTSAIMDGAAARVQLSGTPGDAQQQAANPAPGGAGTLNVFAEGRGRKKLELTLRLKVERSGGWRMVTAQLPSGPAGKLSLTVPDVGTEVRLAGVADRTNFETTAANETIETALSPDTQIAIQWRPKVAEGQIDRSLTIESTAVMDVQEDGLRVAWQAQLQFRRGRREEFSFLLPADYLVQRVIGENVRGWEIEPTEGGQRLDVILLRAATDQETISIYLSKRLPIGDQPVSIVTPTVQVADAALHHGSLTVRRSPLVELRATRLEQVTRTDVDAGGAEALMTAAGQEQRPLPIQPFQTFRFATVPFAVEFEGQAIKSDFSSTMHAILRVGERELLLEARFELTVDRAPIHMLRILLPSSFEVDQVSEQEWVITDEPEGRLLTVYLPSGYKGAFAVNVVGSLGERKTTDPVELPRVRVLDADRQDGQIVVQADPAYRVRAEELQNSEIVPLERTLGWLQDQQRELGRQGLVISYKVPEYQGRLVLARRDPVVRCTTLTNIRVTPRSIQETIMIEFRVLEAGIQHLKFQLPARFASARFRVPALRQKTVTTVEGGDPNQPMIRVDLELQDELMDVIRVVIEKDDVLTPEPHAATIPVVETGEVEAQYVTLQNSSRDEVVTLERTAVEELTRQQTQWRALLELDVTQGYLVRRGAQNPRLVYQTKQRKALETAGARIGLSETMLILDESGAYRALQTLRVENTTEQYLEIELPAGARLWTARVAGEPVKPTAHPDGTSDSVLRIPLVKTEVGDADYPVALIYAGQLPRLQSVTDVHFPLIRTKNIHIERSQITLHVPESYKWMDFRGASKLGGREEYVLGFRSYFGEQVQRITKMSESGSSYERARAYQNLSKLESELQSKESLYRDDAQRMVDSAKQQVIEQEKAQPQPQVVDNRRQLNRFYMEQGNKRSRNIVNSLGNNFSYSLPEEGAKPDTSNDAKFNEEWLEQNRLSKAGKPMDQTSSPEGKIPALDKKVADDELRELNQNVQQQYRAELAPPEQPLAQSLAEEAYDSNTDQSLSSRADFGPGAAMAGGGFGGGGLRDGQGRGGSPGGPPATNAPTVPSSTFADGSVDSAMGVEGDMDASLGLPQQGQMPRAEVEDETRSFTVNNGTSRMTVYADTGLGSLAIKLPERGNIYYFQSPRGQVDLRAKAVSTTFVERIVRVLVALVIGGVLLVIVRPRRRRA